jgi:hypothetical protein
VALCELVFCLRKTKSENVDDANRPATATPRANRPIKRAGTFQFSAVSIVNMFAFRLLTNDNSLRERTVSATGGPTSMAS